MEQFVIIGAGPAGLTAALELTRRTGIKPIIVEASHEIGGISRTVRYKGNRMDIGGHRFFSKSDRVMQWWMDLMPPETAGTEQAAVTVTYQGQQQALPQRAATSLEPAQTVAVPARLRQESPLRGMGPLKPAAADECECAELIGLPKAADTLVQVPPPSQTDLVMLVRPRKSRIYYLRRFFDYPIRINAQTLQNLGPVRMVRIGCSYAWLRVRPLRSEKSLEDFLINRFGRELYRTFFKSYTEKVWGTACSDISAAWGAQRIRGLCLTAAMKHFFTQAVRRKPAKVKCAEDIAQKATDTSLIERFLYPKFGPGQLWEHVAEQVTAAGGEIHLGWRVIAVVTEGDRVIAVDAENDAGETRRFTGAHFISTMPMRELTGALESGGAAIPAKVREVSDGLQYRDFITVGVLAERLSVTEKCGGLLRDTWIYIQEPDVLLGRLQIFNNWSPHMVSDPDKVWIGLEYFCYDTDPLWRMPDEELKHFGAAELEKIGILKASDVIDAHVVRVPKTYPAYFGTYDRFGELRQWVDTFDNLYLVGRNGMHKYNNQDHSMLTAMAVVDGIVAGKVDKKALWAINTEQEYHEEKASK